MKTTIFIGKGGVGKTTSAASTAITLAVSGLKTATIDYDGGHSMTRTLCISESPTINAIHQIRTNLHLAVIDNYPFKGIQASKEDGENLETYLAQFPNDLGIIQLADMVNGFFGVPTDVSTLQKFIVLVQIMQELSKEGFANVIIDVEPTAGLQRLLSTAKSIVRSLRNLSNKGRMSLLAIGAMWPDIKGYLQGKYIRSVENYCVRIEKTVEALISAYYVLVCTPERSPVEQTFDVRKIVEGFGGKIKACVVNGIRGEPHETENIGLLNSHDVPIVKVQRKSELHTPGPGRLDVLRGIGETILQQI